MGELHKIYDDLLTPDNASALQYTASDGLPELRAQVAARLTADGMPCTADDVLITQGGQQGLDLTAKLFVDAGDVIVTERPTFLGALIAFNPCEPRYVLVPMDEEGMDTNALERVHDRAGQAHLHPDFQNPTGRTLSLARGAGSSGSPGSSTSSSSRTRPIASCATRESGCRRSRASTRRAASSTSAASRRSWPRSPARLGSGRARGAGEAVPPQARRRHPERHPEHARGRGLPRRLRHRTPHRVDAADLNKRDLMLTAIAEHFPEGITWTRAQGVSSPGDLPGTS